MADDRTEIEVSYHCSVAVEGQLVYVGDDMHWNGIDSPARLRSVEEARYLIAVLERLIADGTWSL